MTVLQWTLFTVAVVSMVAGAAISAFAGDFATVIPPI
jgi:hypothetical protein